MLLLIPLIGRLYSPAVGHGPLAIVLRAIVAALCLLPPTVLMGATLPAIARWVEDTSKAEIAVEAGSLYPALYRMEQRGWIEAEWGMSELGRKAKFYTLTRAGRAQLKRESAEYERFTHAVLRILMAS